MRIYHLLEDLLKLRIRMICPSRDVIICKLITKALIKLLKYFPDASSIDIKKPKELHKIISNFPVSLS